MGSKCFPVLEPRLRNTLSQSINNAVSYVICFSKVDETEIFEVKAFGGYGLNSWPLLSAVRKSLTHCEAAGFSK